MRTLLAALTALMLFAAPLSAGDREDAQAAYEARDYQEAFQLFKVLAEQGHEETQFSLSVMYRFGKGVPIDDVKSAHWYREAAEQGMRSRRTSLVRGMTKAEAFLRMMSGLMRG